MDTISTTTFLLEFSSGHRGAITATASFGDVVTILLLFALTALSIVQIGVLWKLSLNCGLLSSEFSSLRTSLSNWLSALWHGSRRLPPDVD